MSKRPRVVSIKARREEKEFERQVMKRVREIAERRERRRKFFREFMAVTLILMILGAIAVFALGF